MKLSKLGKPVFSRDLARDMELSGLWIKVQRLDSDCEIGVNSLGGRRSGGGGLGGYAAYCRSSEEVCRPNEVVSMPLA